MEYSFDVAVAKKYGIDEAIMIKNFQFWLCRNKANEMNYHDGHYWTYNSLTAWQILYPFWTVKQIRRILDNLKEKGVIITGNYNNSSYNRTLWYAFSDENLWIGEIDLPKGEISFAQKGMSTITDTLPDARTNSQKDKYMEHVFLYKEEYKELTDNYYQEDIDPKIAYLNCEIANGNSNYIYESDHFAILIKWLVSDVCAGKIKKKPKQQAGPSEEEQEERAREIEFESRWVKECKRFMDVHKMRKAPGCLTRFMNSEDGKKIYEEMKAGTYVA